MPSNIRMLLPLERQKALVSSALTFERAAVKRGKEGHEECQRLGKTPEHGRLTQG